MVTPGTRHRDVARHLVGWAVLAGFFGALGALHLFPVPAENREVVLVLIGQISGAFATVVGYYYQTSLGSTRKTDALVNQGGKETP